MIRQWDVFYDEAEYLRANPDVAGAVMRGDFASGFDHYIQIGASEPRFTKPLNLYAEGVYLARNPDVAAAIDRGAFSTGFQHFFLFGRRESRTFSPFFDEEFYRQRYPDVDRAVSQGFFPSAFEHYRLFGRRPDERRSASPLNEFDYLTRYPDVAIAIDAPTGFFSASHHYGRSGRFPLDFRSAPFSGTDRDDTIEGGPTADTLTGVQRGSGPERLGGTLTGAVAGTFESVGADERDILTGGGSGDTFVLGYVDARSRIPSVVPFYTRSGDSDYAVITDFDTARDTLVLGGSRDTGTALAPVFSFETDGNAVRVVANFAATSLGPARQDLTAIVFGAPSPDALINRTQFLADAGGTIGDAGAALGF